MEEHHSPTSSPASHRAPTPEPTVPKKKQKRQNNIGFYSSAGKNPITFWDSQKRDDVPSVSAITELHVYDFDNTLFKSPMPNPALFTDKAVGQLTNSTSVVDGGWWQDPAPLRQLGKSTDDQDGWDWSGHWNEDILPLLKMSNSDENVLTILMTGRKKRRFHGLIAEIAKSKGIECDAIILKQGAFDTTMAFKTQVLVDIFDFYTNIKMVRIYDDRAAQMKGFQRCLNEYVEAVRPDMIYSLVPVFTERNYLPPSVELKIVSDIVDRHNAWLDNYKKTAVQTKLSLKKSVLFVSYFITEEERALLVPKLIENFPDVFTKQVVDSHRFELEHIPLTRGMLSRKAYAELSQNRSSVVWRAAFIGVSDELIALQLGPIEGITTLITPPILPVACKGGALRPPEDYMTITSWTRITTEMMIPSELTHMARYNLVPADGKKQ